MCGESDRTSQTVTSADPRLGVVVLTHNRADELLRTLAQLAALPEQPEIVVVDNASVDDIPHLVRSHFPHIRCVRSNQNLGAAGRNIGVALCGRPYIALCDDDTWWQPGALARAADLFDQHPALAVITGQVLVGEDERPDPACDPMRHSPLAQEPGLPGRALLGFLAGASVVRRAAFLAAGGFDERLFLGAEEDLLALDLASAGWRLAYVDDLLVHHHPSPQRDAAARERLLARNHLLVAWLRRPRTRALALTLDLLRRSRCDRLTRAGVLDALRAAPWAIWRRRVVPTRVEAQLRLLEAAGFR
ncbi:MAG: glycosyltransferase family 2 protein [Thermomicrobiales bacterium]